MSAESDVRLLLHFFHDLQPGARIGTFGQGKEGPSHNIGCPDCQGLGWVRARKFGMGVVRLDSGVLTKTCQRCSGRGWYPADDYTGREVGTEETGLTDAVVRTVFCDGCGGAGVHGNGHRCRYCEGAGTVAIPAEFRERKPGRSDAMTEALRAGRATGSPGLWAAGSFAALERAISELTPAMRFRLWRDDLPADLVSILAARVRHIERGKIRVPSELRRWQAAQNEPKPSPSATGERNEAMRAMRAEGASLSAIARAHGVSKSQAQRITAK